ncbi:MAG: hypothetical protein JXQ80_03475 [Bacteroidales bacterium]|nr:hypothetical protein [Bacteroidales bacterium]
MNKKTGKLSEYLLRTAFFLAIATIVYNLAEGLVSVFYGIEDETLA